MENLKVIPADTPTEDVIGAMKGFTKALGVRCTFCHVGEEGQPLTTFDFVSDEKKEKEIARSMLRMVEEINGKWMKEISELEGQAETHEVSGVTCNTCHQGMTHPAK